MKQILIGYLLHCLVGCLCVLLGIGTGLAPWGVVLWSAAVGVTHEGTQQLFSDFRHAAHPPAPWNGMLDLLFFVLPATLYLLFWS